MKYLFPAFVERNQIGLYVNNKDIALVNMCLPEKKYGKKI